MRSMVGCLTQISAIPTQGLQSMIDSLLSPPTHSRGSHITRLLLGVVLHLGPSEAATFDRVYGTRVNYQSELDTLDMMQQHHVEQNWSALQLILESMAFMIGREVLGSPKVVRMLPSPPCVLSDALLVLGPRTP
eukprot:scaffold1237_cov403-Prasinococcus_capsulatus_cf.AAC.5